MATSSNVILSQLQTSVESVKGYTDEKDFENKCETAKVFNYIRDIYDNRYLYFNGVVKDTRTYLKPLSENNTNITSYFNIDKTLDNLQPSDRAFIQVKYSLNGKDEILITNTFYNYKNEFSFLVDNVYMYFLGTIVPYKQVNENFEEIDSEYSYMEIQYAKTVTDEMIEIMENMSLEIIISNSNILKKNNNIPYTPTEDYNPSTKKYVDDLTINNQTTTEETEAMLLEVLGGDYVE